MIVALGFGFGAGSCEKERLKVQFTAHQTISMTETAWLLAWLILETLAPVGLEMILLLSIHCLSDRDTAPGFLLPQMSWTTSELLNIRFHHSANFQKNPYANNFISQLQMRSMRSCLYRPKILNDIFVKKSFWLNLRIKQEAKTLFQIEQSTFKLSLFPTGGRSRPGSRAGGDSGRGTPKVGKIIKRKKYISYIAFPLSETEKKIKFPSPLVEARSHPCPVEAPRPGRGWQGGTWRGTCCGCSSTWSCPDDTCRLPHLHRLHIRAPVAKEPGRREQRRRRRGRRGIGIIYAVLIRICQFTVGRYMFSFRYLVWPAAAEGALWWRWEEEALAS